MHDVTASDGHLNVQDVGVLAIDVARQAHFSQVIPDLGTTELVQAKGSLHSADLGLHRSGLQRGVEALVARLDEAVTGIIALINHLHGFSDKGLLAIFCEHRHHGVKHDVGLRKVRGRALNEDVLGLHFDL